MALFEFLNPLTPITKALTEAYTAKLAAENDGQRIEADIRIKNLEAKRDVVIAASVNDHWWSPRTIMGWCAAIYVFKLVVWDTVLGLGVTRNPGDQVTNIVMTIVGFYFLMTGIDRVVSRFSGK